MGILPMSRRAILALHARALAPVRHTGKMPVLRFRRGADLLDRVDAIGQIAV